MSKTLKIASLLDQIKSRFRKILNRFIFDNFSLRFTNSSNGKIKMTVSDISSDKKTISEFFLKPRKCYFDSGSLRFLHLIILEKEILVFYFSKKPFSLGAIFLDRKNPSTLLWRSANAIWSSNKKIQPLEISQEGKKITFSFLSGKKPQSLTFTLDYLIGKSETKPCLQQEFEFISILKKSDANPILKPKPKHEWKSTAVFNPAAIYLSNKVHLIYRAIGDDGLSVFGYASSKDGIHFDEDLADPVYTPKELFECQSKPTKLFTYPNMSGGNWGGCEDPRLVKMDDMIYMTYTAFNGIEPQRIALTSIKIDDFLNKRWHWKKAVLISHPKEINKNWVLFPEKINNQFAVLHSITPNILINYLTNLDFSNKPCIKSCYGHSNRGDAWDNNLRGAGPPPIKTKDGWLLLYHAMDKQDPGKYKLGAMILDIFDPTKILYRSTSPILEPNEAYEPTGCKSGILYCCGAIVKDNYLFIYYGNADKFTCVATANLSDFLEQIKFPHLATRMVTTALKTSI